MFAPSTFNLSYEEVREVIPVSLEDFRPTLSCINEMRVEVPRVDVKLKGGEEISGFRVIHVPGHTPGHIALFDGETLITGDAMRRVGDELRPPPSSSTGTTGLPRSRLGV